jgi:methylmalonyl-CoA mutase N-terminal domain/subunit
MTINGPAVAVFCMYVVAAERQGCDVTALNGTLQTDILKEYIAQKEWIFPPEPHLRLIGDLMAWCAQNTPKYKPLSVSGYHIREAGCERRRKNSPTPSPTGFAYVELGLERGLTIEQAAYALSFFFDAHVDFFEEIGKFRAARRIWARWMRDALRRHAAEGAVAALPHADRWSSRSPPSSRTTTLCALAIESTAAVLGGTQSLHTNALDEVLALPTDRAAQIALRTQQVILEETGVADVIDPLGGSWFVEAVTDRIEQQAEAIFAHIDALGGGSMLKGVLRGIDDGYFVSNIADSAFAQQQVVESGERIIVGVNGYEDAVDAPLEILRISHEVEQRPGCGAAVPPCRARREPRLSAALAGLTAAVASR